MHSSESDAVEPRRPVKLITRRRLLGLAVAGGAGYSVASNVSEVTSHIRQLPGLLEELRVLLLSDAHLPSCYVERESILRAQRGFSPHLTLIVGDSVDKRGNEALVEYFTGLEAPLGVYASLGNWEYWGECDIPALSRAYSAIGIRLLVNEVVTLEHAGGTLQLVGLDDLLGGRPRIGLVRNATAAALLVMAHCPGLVDELPDRPLVALSGHTHGGQIAPFGFKLKTPPGSGPYFKGWYTAGSRRLYVTRGLGNSVVPIRIGSRPEIAHLTFRPA